MLGGAGRNPGAHPDVVSEASLASCIPAVKQYLLQVAGVKKQACVEQALPGHKALLLGRWVLFALGGCGGSGKRESGILLF